MSHRPGWNLSINSISHQNAVGRDKVRRILDELIEAGYLERSENQAHNDKGHLAGYDYVTCDPSALAQEPSKAEPHKAEPTKATEPPKKTNLKEHYKKQEDDRERKSKVMRAELDSQSLDVFETWWEAYPKKADKRVAEQAFFKALKRTNLDTLMAGVLQYSLDPARKPEFTKNPATWLNADAWANAPLVAPEPLNDWGKPFGKPAESPGQREWVRASHDRGEHWECRPGEFDCSEGV
jgi:hypothetical protein